METCKHTICEAIEANEMFFTLKHTWSLQVSFLLHLVYFKHLQLDRYVYPHWVSGVGWFMTLSPVLLVLLWIIGHLSLTAGTFRQVSVFLR